MILESLSTNKYLHNLHFESLSHGFDLVPVECLSLDILDEHVDKSDYLISYLETHSFTKLMN